MHLEVRVQPLNCSTEPLFPELDGKIASEGEIKSVGVLDGGTAGGKVSLGFNILLPDGTWIWVQMTAAILHSLDAVVRGAEKRFEDFGERS